MAGGAHADHDGGPRPSDRATYPRSMERDGGVMRSAPAPRTEDGPGAKRSGSAVGAPIEPPGGKFSSGLGDNCYAEQSLPGARDLALSRSQAFAGGCTPGDFRPLRDTLTWLAGIMDKKNCTIIVGRTASQHCVGITAGATSLSAAVPPATLTRGTECGDK